MTEETVHEGGCLCGRLRYRIAGTVQPAVHCHCSMCRRASGAVVVTWITVPLSRFRFTHGEPRIWNSSEQGQRGFCPDCGAQITFYSINEPEVIDITVASLDHPELHPADHHIWSGDRISWLHLDEHLPHYPRETPPDHGP